MSDPASTPFAPPGADAPSTVQVSDPDGLAEALLSTARWMRLPLFVMGLVGAVAVSCGVLSTLLSPPSASEGEITPPPIVSASFCLVLGAAPLAASLLFVGAAVPVPRTAAPEQAFAMLRRLRRAWQTMTVAVLVLAFGVLLAVVAVLLVIAMTVSATL